LIEPSKILDFLDAPSFARESGEMLFSAILRGEDSRELAETARQFYVRLSGEGQPRPDFVWLCFEALDVGPLVRGAVLQNGWIDGKHGSKLRVGGYSRTRLLRWFHAASPETLMSDADRATLGAFSTLVHAYRGAPAETPNVAAGGISWSLDRAMAEFFAERAPKLFEKPGMVVEGEIPRAAVVAYISERKESEIVVNWRKVRNIRMVNTFVMRASERVSSDYSPPQDGVIF